jgi:hypothetical protein
MIPAKGNGMDIREGKDDIAGNASVEAILLPLCQPLTRFSCSVHPVPSLLQLGASCCNLPSKGAASG